MGLEAWYTGVLEQKVSEDMQILKAKLFTSKEKSKEIKKVVNWLRSVAIIFDSSRIYDMQDDKFNQINNA